MTIGYFTKVLDMKLVELNLGHFGWVENQTLENTLSLFCPFKRNKTQMFVDIYWDKSKTFQISS